jgi:hypothetical protein
MGTPKTKGEALTDTAKSYVRELASQAIFGVDFEVSSKSMDKGIQCEQDSIDLFNLVTGRSLSKNTVRLSDDYLTGECDLLDGEEVVDIKTAWSVATFPLSAEDVTKPQRDLYEYQLRAYMRLWNKPRASIAYCLVDTPENLIGFEPIQLHVVGHIPPHLRVTRWSFDRDMGIEAQMVEKIKAARAYYYQVIAEFDATHRELAEAVA